EPRGGTRLGPDAARGHAPLGHAHHQRHSDGPRRTHGEPAGHRRGERPADGCDRLAAGGGDVPAGRGRAARGHGGARGGRSPRAAVTLVATASDAEDGDLGNAVAWTSSLDGPLGSGATLTGVTLRSGIHTITASVRDRGGRSATDAITLVVNAAPTVAIDGPN